MSRSAALAVTAVFLALVVLFAVAPLYSYSRSLDERVASNKRMIGLLSKGPEYQATLAARYETLRQRVGRHRSFVSADSASLAAAQVVDNLQRMITAVGANSRSTEVLPSEAGPDEIRLRASLQADFAAAARLVAEIETAEPYMFIDRLHIRGDPATRSADTSVLVEIDIVAERLLD